ncbi:MAG TPA: isopropylmalate isomerase, partial [Planctomycetaceae bacterium]|nr:isopropylmalate isomerase [Planctomycetaceae bacterium]
PDGEVTVDLVNGEIRYGGRTVRGEMPDSARQALVTGSYDFLSQLLEGEPDVRRTAAALPYGAVS